MITMKKEYKDKYLISIDPSDDSYDIDFDFVGDISNGLFYVMEICEDDEDEEGSN